MTPQIRSAIVPVSLFALAFVGVAVPLSLGLRAAAPMPEMIVLTPKIETYAANAAKYDTVFIGTSRTMYHIEPDEVERGAAEAGCPGWNVFNFGIFGLTGAEQDWLISRVLDEGGDSLKRVVIEDPLMNGKSFADVTSDRARYFLGPSDWDAQAENITTFPESKAKRLFRGGMMAAGIGYDLSGVGRGSEMLFPPTEEKIKLKFDMSKDGFEALGAIPLPDILARHADFEARPEKFAQDLQLYNAPPAGNVAARADYLGKRLNLLESHGLTAALYISPDLAELNRTPHTGEAVAAQPGHRIVMNFNRPDVYPEFFDRTLWYDFSHLGEAGARKLSYEAGREFCTQTHSAGDTAANALR